jgi:2-polyprenyl-6-hydroxyphenyl methylase/3-demethylubiquinone-9 3-methyltransferase
LYAASVDKAEVAKFTQLAREWWDPKGKFRPLHRLNPVRLSFLRDAAIAHFGRDPRRLAPFTGLTLLDIGCGGGLLSEPLARMGFEVLGIDPSEENIAVASRHCQAAHISLCYRTATAEKLADEYATFNFVAAMEVVEHVANVGAFVGTCARLTAPGGLLAISTINRTIRSLALAKLGAEYVLRWLPPGTHDWSRFVTPAELSHHLATAGFSVLSLEGFRFEPLRWEWQRSRDASINYIMLAGAPHKENA